MAVSIAGHVSVSSEQKLSYSSKLYNVSHLKNPTSLREKNMHGLGLDFGFFALPGVLISL